MGEVTPKIEKNNPLTTTLTYETMPEHKAAKRGIPPKTDFNAWYPFIVEAAELVDKRYPIKGMDVWMPYGWKAMRLIDRITHSEMERTGHGEVRFPLLIPHDLLDKENALVSKLKAAREAGVDPSEMRMDEVVEGFSKEVYWVKNAGENELDVPMFLRPTSETAMYTLFPLWIRSHADLPLKTYQVVNTFRYETKQTRSFIRVREIHFFEAHTAHVDEDDATKQIEEDLEIVDNLMNELGLTVIKTRRPVWDTFPGAWYTIAIDVIMPDGRTLQIASCHHYRDQWAQAFDVKYEDINGEQQYVHQTTYGMSERLMGAVVGIHGDGKGVVFPPQIAPTQAVIVPILTKDRKNEVMEISTEIKDRLWKSGIRTEMDDRDVRPGQKYYDWEIKGVPLRIEIGPRDLDNETVMLVSRDGIKNSTAIKEVEMGVKNELGEFASRIDKMAREVHKKSIKALPKLNKKESGEWAFTEAIKEGFVYEMAFDGSDAQAQVIEDISGLNFLGEAIEEYRTEKECVMTGKGTKKKVYLAKTY